MNEQETIAVVTGAIYGMCIVAVGAGVLTALLFRHMMRNTTDPFTNGGMRILYYASLIATVVCAGFGIHLWITAPS